MAGGKDTAAAVFSAYAADVVFTGSRNLPGIITFTDYADAVVSAHASDTVVCSRYLSGIAAERNRTVIITESAYAAGMKGSGNLCGIVAACNYAFVVKSANAADIVVTIYQTGYNAYICLLYTSPSPRDA